MEKKRKRFAIKANYSYQISEKGGFMPSFTSKKYEIFQK
jgi:hypothetical protein